MVNGRKRILITSGPTRAPLDAVRFITNWSTGRMGTLLVREGLRKGADVTMVYGVGSETPPPHPRLRLVPVETNEDLEGILKKELTRKRYDAVIHAMAVLDFAPQKVYRGKVPSRGNGWTLQLKPTKKIISKIKKWAPKVFLVGFKLEAGVSEGLLLARARRLLLESDADFVVANQLDPGDDRSHSASLVDRSGRILKKTYGKAEVAREVFKVMEEVRGR